MDKEMLKMILDTLRENPQMLETALDKLMPEIRIALSELVKGILEKA